MSTSSVRLLYACTLTWLCAAFSLSAAPNAITPVPPQANFRVASVQVRVVPDHPDWTYLPGQPVRFRVEVTADQVPIVGITVRYTVGPEMMPAETRTVEVPAGGLQIDGGTMTVPGFLRCTVTTEVAGRTYKNAATAAFSPEKIQPYQTEPADFDAFWQKGRDELAKIPMDVRMTLLPDACTSTVNVYHVGIRTVGEGWSAPGRIYGILCEPKAPGKYPAVLRVPGAGVRPYFGDKDLAARGVITLEIGVHGIPVNQPQEIYDQLLAGALLRYWLFNFDDRDTYYYRRIYLSCLRANDFLVSRDLWDGRNLLVLGASQGGQLAIVTAALDRRVTGLSATHPAFCDVAGPLHGRAGGWPHP
ncbi:MAG: acetylxylan esterase, partial [Opitutaceae bacterium]|nr:acetylxylan esterase [Opitutaceae bacterium]